MTEAKLSRVYWPEVVKMAAYLLNRSLSNTFEQKTPFKIFFNNKPNAKYLKLYGSKIFVRIPEQLRQSKWDNKAKLGTLVGYSDTGYRVLINNKVINARHVDVIEQDTICIALDRNESESEHNHNEVESDSNEDSLELEQNNDSIQTQVENADVNIEKEIPRRSNRLRQENPRYFNKEYVTQYVYVYCTNVEVPCTYVSGGDR